MNATVTSRAQVLAVPLLFWLFWEARAWGPQGSVLTRGVVQGGCHGALVVDRNRTVPLDVARTAGIED